MDELLAKPDKKLVDHLLEVYEVGKRIAAKLKLPERLAEKALLACLLHDVGKATKSFQKHVRGQKPKAYPHALASFPFILYAENLLTGKPFLASAAVVSHHSPLSPWLYDGWNKPEWDPQLSSLLEEIFEKRKEYCIDSSHLFERGIRQNPSELLRFLRGEFQNLPIQDFAAVKTVLHLADWLASSGNTDVSKLFLKNGKISIFNFVKLKKFNLKDFQRRASKLETSSDLRLRAPTGSGKTEALLLWAGNAPRILYLLPTQATANAMWMRLSEIYGEENVGISHGRARYVLFKKWEERKHEDEPPLDYRLFATVFAKPVVVATLDQFLMGYMNGKHWEERQTFSKQAAVIIDEIHSYEPFTLGILKNVLKNDKPHKLALASATLPNVLLDLFGGENLVEADEFFWDRRRYRLKLIEEPIESDIQKALRVAKAGGKVLIITNTVQKSQEIFKQIHPFWPQTILLHSRFIYRDRIKKEKQAMEAPAGTILVSTQIVEVSLDISYDILLTELAPVDALIQRMGRVNRRGDRPPVDVFIFKQVDKPSIKVYGKELLEVSREIMEGLPEIPKEKDFVRATNELYDEIATKESFQNELKEGEQNILELRKYLGTYTIDLGDEEFRSRFITRKGIFSVEVIPEQFLDEAYQLIEQGKKWRLVELTVPVHGYWIKVWPEVFNFDDYDYFGYPIAHLKYNSQEGLMKLSKKDSLTSGTEIW